VHTELGRSQVEVQRCPLGSESPWLRSSGAHCAQNLAVEVQPCPLRSKPAVEVQQCPLRAEVVNADVFLRLGNRKLRYLRCVLPLVTKIKVYVVYFGPGQAKILVFTEFSRAGQPSLYFVKLN
jgi:hypothetical protein